MKEPIAFIAGAIVGYFAVLKIIAYKNAMKDKDNE